MSAPKFLIDKEGYAVMGRILVGLMGLFQVASFHLLLAGLAMILCVWTDALTGWFARRRGSKSPSTTALETYADFLCFVILPTYFAFQAVSEDRYWEVWLVLPIFLLAGVYRLARFQVQGLVEGKGYLGLPVTYNGYLFPLMGLCAHFFPGSSDLLVLFLLAVSYLMVSTRFTIPEF